MKKTENGNKKKLIEYANSLLKEISLHRDSLAKAEGLSGTGCGSSQQLVKSMQILGKLLALDDENPGFFSASERDRLLTHRLKIQAFMGEKNE